MYCHNCGKEIPSDSRFCTFCGSVVGNSPIKVKTKATKRQIAARILIMLSIFICAFFVVQNIDVFLFSISWSAPITIASFLSVARNVMFVVLLLVFLFRKNEGYSTVIKALLFGSALLGIFENVWIIFFVSSYVYADESVTIKIVELLVGCLMRYDLWLFVGAVSKKSTEKVAATIFIIGLSIRGIVDYMIISSLYAVIESVIFAMPIIILLFVYPVLSKPVRN